MAKITSLSFFQVPTVQPGLCELSTIVGHYMPEGLWCMKSGGI